MLPLELLRTKITNRGQKINPLFCSTTTEDLSLAQELISEFEFLHKNKATKGELQKRLFLYENSYNDFKLIRGLITLLERRCIFKINQFSSSNYENKIFSTRVPSSFSLRKFVFEESSRYGLPLDPIKRDKIFQNVASKLDISINYLEKFMWLDQENYLILENFSSIKPLHLLGAYNLAILQTLLFNSVNFEFTVKGGTNWKRVLRSIKRFGLMYNLQKNENGSEDNNFPIEIQSNKNKQNKDNDVFSSYFSDDIICSVEGPLSVFKLTNKYGIYIAKVIPNILLSSKWNIKASIIKTNFSVRKIYEFNLSSDSSVYLFNPMNDQFYNNYQLEYSDNISSNFDSFVESNFANLFEKFRTGWKLIREPDPLILPGGRAFIADFLFEKYDKKIYFEIIGFWTSQYLERKFEKIYEILKSSDNKYDLLLAINENNFVSESSEFKKIVSNIILDDNNIIIYKKNSIPMKKILSYLKSIDRKIMNQNLVAYEDRMTEYIIDLLNNNHEIINLEEISGIYGVSIDSISNVISKLSTNEHIEKYIVQNSLLISKKKLNKIQAEIVYIDDLIKIQKIFENNNIPIQHTIDILKYLGYEIIWKGIDSSNIIIKRNT